MSDHNLDCAPKCSWVPCVPSICINVPNLDPESSKDNPDAHSNIAIPSRRLPGNTMAHSGLKNSTFAGEWTLFIHRRPPEWWHIDKPQLIYELELGFE